MGAALIEPVRRNRWVRKVKKSLRDVCLKLGVVKELRFKLSPLD